MALNKDLLGWPGAFGWRFFRLRCSAVSRCSRMLRGFVCEDATQVFQCCLSSDESCVSLPFDHSRDSNSGKNCFIGMQHTDALMLHESHERGTSWWSRRGKCKGGFERKGPNCLANTSSQGKPLQSRIWMMFDEKLTQKGFRSNPRKIPGWKQGCRSRGEHRAPEE